MSKKKNTIVRFNMLPLYIEDKLFIDEDIYTLKFPAKLYDFLQEIMDRYNRTKKKKKYVEQVYIKPLSDAIKSKYNSIITTDNRINQNTLYEPWIYSCVEYDLAVFKQYIKEWLEGEPFIAKNMNIDVTDDCFDEFKWEKHKIEIDFGHNEIGTSIPDKKAYNFLLSYIGHKLNGKIEVTTEGIEEVVESKGKPKLVSGKKSVSTFKFYNVSTSDQGAELISWPPIKVQDKDMQPTHYWTYKIILNLITIPYEKTPYLNISVQTLKFCNTPIKTRDLKNVTAYIKLPNRAIRGDHESLFIKAAANVKIEDKTKWIWNWEYGFEKAMKNMMLDRYIPHIQEVANNPLDFILGDEMATVAVQFGTHIRTPKNNKSVGSGVAFADEAAIINETVNTIKNSGTMISKFLGDLVIKEDCYSQISKDSNEDNIEFKLDKIPVKIDMEAYYYNIDWFNKLKMSVAEAFKVKTISHELLETQIKENSIIIINKETGETKTINLVPINTKEWDTENKEFFKVLKTEEAYNEFCKELRHRVRKGNDTIGVFFELEDKDDFQGYVDPKKTIRRIFAEKNRLTQFITPTELPFISEKWPIRKEEIPKKNGDGTRLETIKDDEADKFISGTRDMLRQLGIINKNIPSLPQNPDSDVVYVGLWFTTNRYSRKFPILVAIKDGVPYISFYKEEDRNVKWHTYINGQIELGTNPGGRIERNRKVNEANLRGFIIKAIKQLKSHTRADTIILYSVAQNCRSMLSWYNNTNFGVGEAVLTLEENELYTDEDTIAKGQTLEDCIIVRLRTTDNNEVPNWMKLEHDEQGNLEEKPNQLYAGVYSINEKAYYSIQGKPSTFQMGSMDIRSIKEDNPFKNYLRPNALEILIPYVYESYSINDIVNITHFMRKEMAISYNDALRLPLPIHLAKSACEYAEAYYEEVGLK